MYVQYTILSASERQQVKENADDDEYVRVQRPPNVTVQLWGSLLKSRGYEVAHDSVMLSPGKARELTVARDMTCDGAHEAEAPPERAPSVLSSFRRANSFAASGTGTGTGAGPFRRRTKSRNARAEMGVEPAADFEASEGDGDDHNAPSSADAFVVPRSHLGKRSSTAEDDARAGKRQLVG
ncbi:hypothetical protein C8R43DRAFT_952954 [Mycena crocata]|nr:hypothetical protein C8R43DRAFT_952954 [Mycena crocata]